LCCVENRVVRQLLFAESTATGLVFKEMLGKHFLPVLEEGGPNGMLFQQDWGAKCVVFYSAISQGNGLARVGLSLGRPVHLT
jgi:hypothetical protein